MPSAARADAVFEALASPTRRALLDALERGERPVTALVAALDVSQSAVSQQLAVLKRAGLVAERRAGRFRYYRLCARPLARVEAWLRPYRARLEAELDALGRVLDALPDAPAPGARSIGTTTRRSRR